MGIFGVLGDPPKNTPFLGFFGFSGFWGGRGRKTKFTELKLEISPRHQTTYSLTMLTLPVYDLVPSCGASARVSSYKTKKIKKIRKCVK